MSDKLKRVIQIKKLNRVAYAPYETIEHPTTDDWAKSYDALKQLCELEPEVSTYG